jgi:hypothetical protein
MVFDGTDDFVSIGSPLTGTPNTVMLWIKYAPSLGRGVLLGNYPDPNNLNWEIHTDGKPRVFWNNGEFDYKFDDDVRGTTWNHLAFVRDTASTAYNYYRGAVLVDTRSLVGTSIVPTTTHFVGKDRRGSSTPMFQGEMTMLRIFSSAISASDIATQMTSSCCLLGLSLPSLLNLKFKKMTTQLNILQIDNTVEHCGDGNPAMTKRGGDASTSPNAATCNQTAIASVDSDRHNDAMRGPNVSCHKLAQIVGQLLLGVFHLYTFYPLYHIR